MNPWSHQKQREKALQKYYDRLNPRPKKQESEMAYDPREQERREWERMRQEEYLLAKQQAQMMQVYNNPMIYPGIVYGEPQKPLEKSVSTECIVGLRVWKIVDDKGLPKLASVVKSTVLWPYRKALERDPIMAEGIHAVRLGDRVVGLFNEYAAHVAGEVYLWGKVIECDSGWLADCAYPKRFLVPMNFDPIKAMQLEDEYGVPCDFREEFTVGASGQRTATATMQMLAQQLYPQALMGGFGVGKLPWQP